MPVRRFLLALVPFVLAVLFDWMMPGQLHPWHWYIFYPAAFFSSWIGGRRFGLICTFVMTAIVWWVFIPPEKSLIKPPIELLPAAVFLIMGVFFAVFHDRLRSANTRMKKLVEERRIFFELIENSNDFIGISDAEGRARYVNPAGRCMVGMSSEQPIGGTTIPDYFPADQQAFVKEAVHTALRTQSRWRTETSFRDWKTGQPIAVSSDLFPISEPGTGRVLGWGSITRDISDLRRAREAVQAANRKLQDLDEMKTRFFANVSHELRTPLSLVLGPARALLASPAIQGDCRYNLQVIERNAQALLGHVDDLLEVAKLDSRTVRIEHAPLDVSRLVRFAAGHFGAIATESDIRYSVETPESLSADLDADKLRRVLFSLISNAFKFTPRGGSIRVSVRESGDARFVIEVADSGPGIPPDKRDSIFERFRQLDEGTARRFGGTGLGLSIARELTVLQGGQISAAAAPEGGALFALDMPRTVPSGAPVHHAEESAEQTIEIPRLTAKIPPALGDGPAGAPLVLIVEDDADMAAHLAMGLVDRYRVATASDGQQGLQKAMELRPDVVLTDLMMPGVSGEELVSELRKRVEFDAVPIVIITARADDNLCVRLLEQGATDYLVKPFKLEELRARVANLVSKKIAEERLALAIRARDEVLGVVAHDLRNPLNTIVIQATLIQRSAAAKAEESGQVESIRRSATRMNRLIQDLLDVTRLEAGRSLAMERRAVSAPEIVREALEAHAPSAQSKSIEMVSRVDECGDVVADRGRVMQVLDNLVGNAIKFTPAGGRITLGVTSKDGEVVFSVADTGTGLPPQAVEHLFDRFWQGQDADRRGVGLGLSVAKSIVEAHGGRIWIESKPGAGTRACFTIPKEAAASETHVANVA